VQELDGATAAHAQRLRLENGAHAAGADHAADAIAFTEQRARFGEIQSGGQRSPRGCLGPPLAARCPIAHCSVLAASGVGRQQAPCAIAWNPRNARRLGNITVTVFQ
jgi:hypothetical protein